ncbi:peptidase family M3, partial [Aureobasidium melanogenum]
MQHQIPPQQYPQLIPTDKILTLTEQHINTLRTARNNIVKDITLSTATFLTVVKPLAEAQHSIEDSFGMIAMLRYASPDANARAAAEQARSLWNLAFSEFADRSDVYILLQAVKDRNEDLDAESAKYLDELLADFVRCGHGVLDAEGIAEYVARRNKIDELRAEFTKNVRNCEQGIWLSEYELEGVLEQDITRFRNAGAKQPRRNSSDGNKTCFVALNKHDVGAVLQYATNSEVRKRMYIAHAAKLPENLSIFDEVLRLRDLNARQLGYKSHAAFRLEKRLAKTTQWVYDFLDKLEGTLLPQGKKEMTELLAFRASQVHDSDCDPDTMLAWDYPYYKRLLLEKTSVSHDKIAEYFPIQAVVPRMLDLFSDCLQMRFVAIPSPEVWHPDVSAWEVWDDRSEQRNQFIGYLYTDLVFRENKHRGCQNVNLQPSYIDSEGARKYPATLPMCNFPPFTPAGSPSCILLKHSQLISLFHELGHGIHDLLSRTTYSRFHGWRSPPDYAEALSIMLENYVWPSSELKLMSCHYTSLSPELLHEWQIQHPDEKPPIATIPDHLLDPLIQSRFAFRAMYMLQQLADSRFDMTIHDPPSHTHCTALNPTILYTDLHSSLTLLSTSEYGHPHTDFTHLLAGYDAGYYGYLSAQVFAADIFAQFADSPRNRESWERYRKLVLERGASTDELQNLEEFLGRPVDGAKLVRF